MRLVAFYKCLIIITILKGDKNMSYSNIVVAGGGVLGSQIAFQVAYCGFNVTIWLRSEGSIGRTQPKLDTLKQTYIDAIEQMSQDKNAWCAGLADEDNFDKEA